MEKNRLRPVKNGKSFRMSFSRQKEVLEMPNLIEIQKNSYDWFLTEGLREVFDDISPIEDFSNHLSLEFVDFQLCRNDRKYSIEECKERDATYAAPLKVKVRLHNKETGEMTEHEIFIMELTMINSVRNCTHQLSYQTEVHGWSMKLILMISSMCVWTEQEKFLLPYLSEH